MAVPQAVLQIYQGSLFTVTIPAPAGATSGWGVRMQLRSAPVDENGIVSVTLTTGGGGIVWNGANGWTATITPTQSNAMTLLAGVWDAYGDPDGVPDNATVILEFGTWSMRPLVTSNAVTPSPNPNPLPSDGNTIYFSAGNGWLPTARDWRSVGEFGVVDITGNNDSSAAFQAAINALAGTGPALFVPSGTYKLTAGLMLKANLQIVCSPGVSFVSSLGTGAFGTSTVPFIASPTYGPTITFNASASSGSYQVVLNTAVNVGDVLALMWSDGFHGGQYKVIATSGTSTPQTVTLDRALDLDFPSSSTAQVITNRSENIVFEGNGCSVSGTCERYFEILSPYRCHFRDIVIDATNYAGDTQTALSLDTWGLESSFERVKIINALTGMAIESGTRCRLIDCVAVGRAGISANTGILIIDCIACTVVRPGASLWLQGVVLSEGSANNIGCIECGIEDGLVTGCTTGIVVAFAQDCSVRGTYANGNTLGFSINGNATLISNVGGRSNGTLCIVVGPGCAIDGIDCSNNTSYGIQAQATCTIRGLISTGGNAGGQVVYVGTAGVTVYLSSFDITISPAAFAVQVNNATSRLVMRSGHIAINANGSEGIFVNAGVVDVDGLTVDGSGTGCFSIDVASGATLRSRNFVDSIGQRLQSGAKCNRKQTLIANGTSGVAVSFPDIRATDAVQFTLQSIGGTAGHPKYTITPGTGFTFTSDTSDTSTYEWLIG